MSPMDMVMMAVKNLWKRKLRTLLTVLGVVIGTASIVVMMSIGIGLNESYTKELEEWGSLQIIEVYNYNWDNSGGDISLDDDAVESFKAMDNVDAVAPMVETYGLLVANNRFVSDTSIRGMDPELMETFGFTVSEGRPLQVGDKMQVVLGAYTKDNFRNPKLSWQASMNAGPPEIDVYNDRMLFTLDHSYGTKYADSSIKAQKIEVVGVMDGSNQNAYYTIMPLDQVIKIKEEQDRRNKGNYGGSSSQKEDKYNTILVKVNDTDNVMDVQQAIKDMGYTAYSLADSLESINEMTNMIQLVLGAIGAVSMLVAAISISNTMIMAIYERTKEIGIMKVIGAKVMDIERLFLTEAAFIGLSGGVAGVVISYLISFGINYVIKASGQSAYNISSIPLWLSGLALLFSTLVGILAGYLPAKRATKVSALTAIRTE